MNNLWKGIAICGIWTAVAVSAYFIGENAIWVGFFAMLATGYIAND